MSAWPGWEADVLRELGAIAVGPAVTLLAAWHACEGGTATFNPLNTTQPEPGSTNYNSVGVKNYPDQATGLRATVDTLTNGFYTGIVSDLRSGGVTAAAIVSRNAPEFSTWGTSTVCLAQRLGTPVTVAPPRKPAPGSARGEVAYTLFPNYRPITPTETPHTTNVLTAWRRLMHAVGVTVPTQDQRTRDRKNRFVHAIR